MSTPKRHDIPTTYEHISSLEDGNIPRVHLQHGSGAGPLVNGFPYPKLAREGESPDDFLLVPVKEMREVEGERDLDTISTISMSSESYEDCLRRTNLVAIARVRQGRKGGLYYISCRRSVYGLGFSFLEYRKSLGRYEVFEKEYSEETDTFSFKSHNGLYLHFDERTSIAACLSSSNNVARWTVRQRAPGHIDYLGLVDLASSAPRVIAESASPKLNRDDFNYTVAKLQESQMHTPNQSTIFSLPDTRQRWVVQTDEDGITTIAIASLDYPLYMAVECCDYGASLLEVRRKIFLENKKILGKSHSKTLNEKLLASRIYFEEFPIHKLSAAEREVAQQMQENIQGLINTKEIGEELLGKSNDLLEQAKIFKKQAHQLKSNAMNRSLWWGVGITAGAAGGLAGWLVGGPAGAAWLGCQTAEIGAGIACGVGAAAGASRFHPSNVTFWTRNFVPVPIPRTK